MDHVVIGIDGDFPLSEPRVVAIQAVGSPIWPHVEKTGVLCLSTTAFSAPAGQRIKTTFQNAMEVLQMDASLRSSEFREEFISYWSQEVDGRSPEALSLLDGRQEDRDIVWWRIGTSRIVLAESAAQMSDWLRNQGRQVPTHFRSTRLHCLPEPLEPEQFPRIGADVMALVGRSEIERHLLARSSLPIVIVCIIHEQPVFVATEIHGPNEKHVQKGFRPSRPRSAQILADSYRCRQISRLIVRRADAAWIHGRGNNPDFERLKDASVAVVGCGAIGGYLARGLAQAGVGHLMLIDRDQLAPNNIGRHVLGMEWATYAKSRALAGQIQRDFPHVREIAYSSKNFQNLTPTELCALSKYDALILAGIDLPGELAVDRWRHSLSIGPALIWTWIEEFALAGHAAALFAPDSVRDCLDADGCFNMRLTSDWPKGSASAVEAGCAVVYQPYNAVDMMGTVSLAQRLTLDVLLGKVQASVLRSWLGNRDEALSRGCKVSSDFDRSFSEILRQWKH